MLCRKTKKPPAFWSSHFFFPWFFSVLFHFKTRIPQHIKTWSWSIAFRSILSWSHTSQLHACILRSQNLPNDYKDQITLTISLKHVNLQSLRSQNFRIYICLYFNHQLVVKFLCCSHVSASWDYLHRNNWVIDSFCSLLCLKKENVRFSKKNEE